MVLLLVIEDKLNERVKQKIQFRSNIHLINNILLPIASNRCNTFRKQAIN